MAHKASKRTGKYLEKYLREGVPLHNKIFGELYDQLPKGELNLPDGGLYFPMCNRFQDTAEHDRRLCVGV